MAKFAAILVILSLCYINFDYQFVSSEDAPIPGITNLQVGFDITKLNLFPTADFDQGKAALNFLDFTYNKGQRWYFPDVKKWFRMPDQVSVVNSLPSTSVNISTQVKQTILDISIGVNAAFKGEPAISIPIIPDIFDLAGAGASMNGSFDLVMKKNSAIISVSQSALSHEAFLLTPDLLEPSSSFASDLNKLTGNYEDNSAAYDKFVENYGTHFFVSAKFGGQLALNSIVTTNFLRFSGNAQAEACAKFDFIKLFKLDADVGIDIKATYESYSVDCNSDFRRYGGSAQGIVKFNTSIPPNDLKEWESSLKESPWLVKGHLMPISNLVKNENTKHELEVAIYVKVSKASLNQMLPILDLIAAHYLDYGVLPEAPSVGNQFGEGFKEIAQEVVKTGEDIVHGIIDGISDFFGSLGAPDGTTPKIIPTCLCTADKLKELVNENLNRKVPVRHDVYILQKGILEIQDILWKKGTNSFPIGK